MTTFEELNKIFQRVFDDEDISITPESTSNDIEGWDSLSHVNLVVSIEKHFKIRFRSSEIIKWKNVGQMYDSIMEKLGEK
jgi:acyl carrier protein